MAQLLGVCRLCLAVDVRMIKIADTPLQLVYETITNTRLLTDTNKPTEACYICHYQLNKCRKLVETAKRAENALTAIFTVYKKITKASISSIDRNANNLCSPLTITRDSFGNLNELDLWTCSEDINDVNIKTKIEVETSEINFDSSRQPVTTVSNETVKEEKPEKANGSDSQIFTPLQKQILEKEFFLNHFMDQNRLNSIRQAVGLTDQQILCWLQNRQMQQERDQLRKAMLLQRTKSKLQAERLAALQNLALQGEEVAAQLAAEQAVALETAAKKAQAQAEERQEQLHTMTHDKHDQSGFIVDMDTNSLDISSIDEHFVPYETVNAQPDKMQQKLKINTPEKGRKGSKSGNERRAVNDMILNGPNTSVDVDERVNNDTFDENAGVSDLLRPDARYEKLKRDADTALKLLESIESQSLKKRRKGSIEWKHHR